MAKIKETDTTNADENAQKMEHSYIAGRNKNDKHILKTDWQYFTKLNMQGQPSEWKKIFAKSDKDLVSKIYKDLLQLINKKTMQYKI